MNKESRHRVDPLFKKLKNLTGLFSLKATPLALTGNSLVVEDYGIITKGFLSGGYWPHQTVIKHIICEARSLKLHEGRIGDFCCPRLHDEPQFFTDMPDCPFIGLIQMTKMPGKPVNQFLDRGNSPDHKIYAQLGELIATLHDLDPISRQIISPYESGNYIMVPAGMDDETLIRKIDTANRWFSENKKPTYAHLDLHYENIFCSNNGGRLEGCIDFAYAGLHDNPYLDFGCLHQPQLEIVVQSYQAVGRNVDHIDLRIEFAKLCQLACYVNYLTKHPNDREALHSQKLRLEDGLNLLVSHLG
ncbi:MAG: phosphotransferase [Alphaproteobacteria bacterium]|nr:phosphotransferase [Alphaproteobacteria bacterium]